MRDEITPNTVDQPVGRQPKQQQTFRYDGSEPQSVGLAIIQAVAAVADVDALSLEPRLYDVIDPDALERVLSDSKPGSVVQVSFEFGQYLVTVTSDHKLTVRPLEGGTR